MMPYTLSFKKRTGLIVGCFLAAILCILPSQYAQAANINLFSSKLPDNMMDTKEGKELLKLIEVTPDEIPDGVDKEIVREIKAISAIYIQYVKDSETISLKEYKNTAFVIVPSKELYAIFPPPIDAKTAVLYGNGSRGKEIRVESAIFVIDKNTVYKILDDYRLQPLDTIDAPTFTEIFPEHYEGASIFKDKNNIYQLVNEKLYFVKDADPATFEEAEMRAGFSFRDKDSIYFSNNEDRLIAVEDVDAATFQLVTDTPKDAPEQGGLHSYFSDKNNRYYYAIKGEMTDKPLFEAVLPIQGIDINSIKTIFATIYEQDGAVYYTTLIDSRPIKLEGVDSKKFHPIPKTWNLLFTDGEKIFAYNPDTLRLQEIPGAVYDQFNVFLTGKGIYAYGYNTLVFGDKNTVYYLSKNYEVKSIEGADASSFKAVYLDGKYTVAKDAKYVYFMNCECKNNTKAKMQITNVSDPASFEIIAHSKILMGKDKNSVYTISGNTLKPYAKIDPKKFEVLDDLNTFLAKDDKKIYTVTAKTGRLSIFRGINAKTFSIAGHSGSSGNYPIIKDNKSVWYFSQNLSRFKKIAGANPATFDIKNVPNN